METAAQKAVYTRLCTYDDFEEERDDDDDNMSWVSSHMGSKDSVNNNIELDANTDNIAWEYLNEDKQATKQDDGLKKLGNVSRKRMRPMILKGFLVADGTVAANGLKKAHEKALLKHMKKLE